MAKGSIFLPFLPEQIDFEVNSVVEGIVQNTAPTGVILLDTSSNPITPVSITQLINEFEIVIATGSMVPAIIEINAASFKTVNPGDTLDIAILNSLNVAIGTPDALNNKVDIADATVLIQKSDSTLIFSFDIAAEDLDSYNVADSVAVLKDTLGNTLSSTNIKATESEDIIAPDATFNLDNTSGATLFLGSIAAGDNETIIAPDGDIENSDASYTASVESGGVLVVPDINIEVNTVVEGTIPALKDVKILITDGVNPVTPDDVSVVGDTVTVEVPSGGGSFDVDLVDRFGNAFPTKQVTANATWDLRTLTPFDFVDIFLTNATGSYTSGEEQAIRDAVSAWAAAGIWQRRRAIYLFTGKTAFDNSLNLKYPFGNDNSDNLIFIGSPTHDSNGVTFGATSVGLIPQTTQTLFGRDSYNLFIYSRTDSALSLGYDAIPGQSDGATLFAMQLRDSSNVATANFTSSSASGTNADSKGGYHANAITGTSASKFIKNGATLIGSATLGTYSGLQQSHFNIGGRCNYRGASLQFTTSRNYAGLAMGLNLTDMQMQDDYDIWQQFQTDFNGRQV
jgi:hypothetical protein